MTEDQYVDYARQEGKTLWALEWMSEDYFDRVAEQANSSSEYHVSTKNVKENAIADFIERLRKAPFQESTVVRNLDRMSVDVFLWADSKMGHRFWELINQVHGFTLKEQKVNPGFVSPDNLL